MSDVILIDDSNPVVQYAPGWIWDQLVHDEVDHTRHGAAINGLTASLGFTGTGVEVFGTLEPTDDNGRPTTTYSIDGEVVNTYHAPFTSTEDTKFNVTFFSMRDLERGNHMLVITNVNGTTPNIFWLDYILVYASSSTVSAPTSSGPMSTSSSSPDVFGTPGPNNSSGSAASNPSGVSGPKNIGAIVGGLIGGLALLVLLAIFILLWRKHRPKVSGDVSPFVHVPHQPSLSPSPPSSKSIATRTNQVNAPQMSSRASASVVGSSIIVSNLPDATSIRLSDHDPADTPITISNALTDGLPSADSEPKYSQSVDSPGLSAASGSFSIPTLPQSNIQLVSPRVESSSHSIISSPVTPYVHADVSRAPWTAPVERQSLAQSLLRKFSVRDRRQDRHRPPMRDIDSGLRLYNEPALPPPYTAD